MWDQPLADGSEPSDIPAPVTLPQYNYIQSLIRCLLSLSDRGGKLLAGFKGVLTHTKICT